MDKLFMLITAGCLWAVLIGCETGGKAAGKPVDLNDSKQAFSYALGLDVAASLDRFKDDIDLNAFTQALTDTMVNGKSLIASMEAQQIRSSYFQKMQDEKKQKNLSEGKAFLEKNKNQPGVITTESGLQYKVITPGTGATPTADDKVKVHYRGTLIDGKEFDSSYKRGQPATFGVTGVIKAWTEILQLIKVGSKMQIWTPPELAYGERGAGRDIGPNATLIFEIELLEIVK